MVQEVGVVVGIVTDGLFMTTTIIEMVVVSLNVGWASFGHFLSL